MTSAPASGELVCLRERSVDLGYTPVLRDLDLQITAGETVVVSGRNGSGKSTLLHVLALLLTPAAGTGHVLGVPLGSPDSYRFRAAVGLVGHSPAVYPELTLRENLRLVCRLLGIGPASLPEALRTVGLADAADLAANACSQGMLRRLDLARVLLCAPRLLLLDEPHSGLDTDAATLVDLLVDRTRERGGASVVVSHEPDRFAPHGARLAELVDGTVRPGEPVLL